MGRGPCAFLARERIGRKGGRATGAPVQPAAALGPRSPHEIEEEQRHLRWAQPPHTRQAANPFGASRAPSPHDDAPTMPIRSGAACGGRGKATGRPAADPPADSGAWSRMGGGPTRRGGACLRQECTFDPVGRAGFQKNTGRHSPGNERKHAATPRRIRRGTTPEPESSRPAAGVCAASRDPKTFDSAADQREPHRALACKRA